MSRLQSVRWWAGTALAATAAFLVPSRASADSTALFAIADTTLSAAAPENNLGGHTQILVGTDGSGRLRRGLLSFGVAGELPPGAIIHSATLYLTATSANPAAGDFRLHRMLVDWGQGTGTGATGSPATALSATWNNRLHGTAAWGAGGGLAGTDYASAISSTAFVGAAGEYAFTGLAGDVQMMVDNPSGNFGWMLVSGREGTPQTARQFIAGEFGGATAPRLELEYSIIPEPATLTLALAAAIFGSTAAAIHQRRNKKPTPITP